MRGQVTRGFLIGLLAGLLVACGSTTNSSPDTRPAKEVGSTPPPVDSDIGGPDAGCDEDAMGEDFCIINSPGGNPSVVARFPAPDYNTCK